MNKKILKERKRNMKCNKGITLIALIITIVVLLILAVVSIGAVQDSNIIAHAQNAATGYNTAKEKEEGLLNEYEQEIDKLFNKVGVKVCQLPATMGNGVAIITPENEMILFMGGLLPYDTGILTEDISAYQVTYSNEFTEEEISKLKLLTNADMGGIIAITEDRNVSYCTSIPKGSTNVTITKDVTLTHSDELLAQYYHEDGIDYYHMPAYDDIRSEVLYFLNKSILYNVEEDAYVPITVVDKGIVSAADITTVQVDGSEVTIREGAQKIEITVTMMGTSLRADAYLQDGNLYCSGGCATPNSTKFFNTGSPLLTAE